MSLSTNPNPVSFQVFNDFPENDNWLGGEIPIIHRLALGTRIFAVGEAAHFVREFNMSRIFLARFLIKESGFTHIAMEIGSIEAGKLNSWLQGIGTESDLSELAGPLTYGLRCNVYND